MQLVLDESKIKNVRELINSSPIFYESSKFKPKWNIICSFMDRIEDSARELNELKLLSNKENTNNQIMLMFVYTDIVKSCIDTLVLELEFEVSNLDNVNIFDEIGFDGQGTDDKYFYFLRNLSFAHVLDVSRSRTYLISNGEKERLCAPIVSDNGSKIVITAYSNIRKTSDVSPVVEKSKIFQYISQKYNVLDEIDFKLREVIQNYESIWKLQLVDTSKDIIQMLDQLKRSYLNRFDKYTSDHIDEIIKLLRYRPQIQNNVEPIKNLQKYACRLAQDFIEMFNINDESVQNHEFFNLFNISREIGINNSNYMLEKIQVYLTEDESGENDYRYSPGTAVELHNPKVYLGFEMLREFKREFSDKYVTIDYDMPFFEIQFLVWAALYMFHSID